MTIKLTENAANQVREYMKKDGGVGLRLGVKKTGCSGWAYTVELAKSIAPDDVVFDDHGVKVVIPHDSLSFLDGSEVDFGVEGLGRAFRFNNPNVTEQCGCGESFTFD